MSRPPERPTERSASERPLTDPATAERHPDLGAAEPPPTDPRTIRRLHAEPGRPTDPDTSAGGPAGPGSGPPHTEAGAVDYFGRHAPLLLRLKSSQSLKARQAMFDDFLRLTGARPGQRVLDVGVTPDTALPDSNAFVRLWPTKHTLTVTSVEDASNLEHHFPGVSFVRTSGVALPFPDGAFDVAHSSAVLEHVGDRERQRAFLHEVCRVAKVVFLTTPNRWFPLELHTFLPVAHWLPQPTHQRILRTMGLDFWAETDNLDLLSARTLTQLFPPGASLQIHRHRLLGLTSNLVVYGPTGH